MCRWSSNRSAARPCASACCPSKARAASPRPPPRRRFRSTGRCGSNRPGRNPAARDRDADPPAEERVPHRRPDRRRVECLRDFGNALTVRIEGADGGVVQQLRVDGETGSVTFPLGDAPRARFRRRRAAIRPPRRFDPIGTDRAVIGSHARRTRAGSVADRDQRLGDVHPSAVRRVRSDRTEGVHAGQGQPGTFAGALPARRCLPLDVSWSPRANRRDDGRIREDDGPAGDAAALDVRLSAIAPHTGRTEEIIGVARTFREKKLPCDTLIYLGTVSRPRLEYAQRRVHLASEEFSRPEED